MVTTQGSQPISECRQQLHIAPLRKGDHSGVERYQPHTPTSGECQQKSVSHLTVTDDGRNVIVNERYIVGQEAMTINGSQGGEDTLRIGDTDRAR